VIVPSPYRDLEPYRAKNLVGALLPEAERVFGCLEREVPLNEIQERAFQGSLFTQKALLSRKRFWYALTSRYFKLPEWVIEDIIQAYRSGPHSREFISLLYLHYALSDHFTFDFIIRDLWKKWTLQQVNISSDDIFRVLDAHSVSEPQITSWTESTRIKMAGIILSSLRDFGLLEGKQKKKLVKPLLPTTTSTHILRILIAEGVRGNEILSDPTWRLFFCTEEDVAHHLQQLAQKRYINFERTGKTVVLIPPDEWSN
jgi:hypothetical protein